EHNRSVPAALKNALDVGSRPYGKNVWNGKPALIISSSISGISGFGANHHLRQMLAFLNMPTVQQPEVYLANVQDYFDDSGNLVKDDTAQFLRKVLNDYIQFVSKFQKTLFNHKYKKNDIKPTKSEHHYWCGYGVRISCL